VVVPFKPRARDKPKSDEPLPSISEQMQRQIEADQTDIKKQLKHAQQQLALTNVYPGRKVATRSNIIDETKHASIDLLDDL